MINGYKSANPLALPANFIAMKKILETARCYVRELIHDDIALVCQMNRDPDVMQYISNGKPQTDEYSTNRTLYFIDEYYAKHPGLGMWAVVHKEDEQFMGWACLKHFEGDLIEVGYRLIKDYWGKGYATEVSKALIHYGFNTLSLDKIIGVAAENNTKSQHILQKIGLSFLKEDFYHEIKVRYYQLLKQDYVV